MYKEKIKITSIDVDNHLELKLSSIFKYFQQVSTNHSEIIHVGVHDTIDQGMCWVLSKMKVVIRRYPKINETITVATHPGETKKFLYPRYYHAYDAKGNLIISASSIWVVIDMNTRRLNTNPFPNNRFKGEVSKDDIELPASIICNSEFKEVDSRPVKYSDIDLNGHLNNTKYVEYIVDVKNKDYYDQYQIKSITLNYEKEIRCEDVVSLLINEDNYPIIKGQVNGNNCFTAQLEIERRKN